MKKDYRVVVDLTIQAEDATDAERSAVATLDGGLAWAPGGVMWPGAVAQAMRIFTGSVEPGVASNAAANAKAAPAKHSSA